MEIVSNPVQTVNAGQNVIFNSTTIPCSQGYVLHRNGSGLVTLRGVPNRNCCDYATYKISFGANIAISTGGTVEPISIALAVDGEVIPTSSSIVTPAAVGDYFNVYDSIYLQVPRGCCYTIAVENSSTQAIDVQNANLIVEKSS